MNTKKLIIAFTLIIALSLGVCIITRAEEMPSENALPSEELISDTYTSSDEAENLYPPPEADEKIPENSDIPEDNSNKGDTQTDESRSEDVNFFDTVYKALMAHSGEILGALTFIASLILAYAYRRGLLPIIKSALSSLAEAIGAIKSTAEENGEYSKALADKLSERLDQTENTLVSLAGGIERLTEELYENKLDRDERAKMKLIINSQIDMLYNIFMTSSLPEFQKAAMSEKIAAMRKELEG